MTEKTKLDGARAGDSAELASISSRFVALFIDGMIQAIVGFLALALIGLVWGNAAEFLTQFFTLALPIAYNWYFWTRRDGQTPGKSALGIRVVKADGAPLSDVDALIRAIGYHISALICGLGYIWAIFDKNNQAWHDKLASTAVVRKDRERHTAKV